VWTVFLWTVSLSAPIRLPLFLRRILEGAWKEDARASGKASRRDTPRLCYACVCRIAIFQADRQGEHVVKGEHTAGIFLCLILSACSTPTHGTHH